MSDSTAAEADRKLEAALEAHGARDPREFYRERLRELKEADAEAYERAVAYYRDTLIPSIAKGEAEALDAWTEYGRTLAVALRPGRTVRIDTTGKAHPYEAPSRKDLVLQIPDGKGGRAVLVALPSELSRAQRATYAVLVSGKTRAPG
ncbi:MAG: hypothetical protein WD995_05220 [Gemmatimonadota bacterium]